MLFAVNQHNEISSPPSAINIEHEELDVVSRPGAAVAQLLSAFQTGQIRALTGLVCRDRLSPDVALTPLPSCMLFTFRCWHLLKGKGKTQQCLLLPFPDRNQKLTMLGFKTPQPGTMGPVRLPRTDWTLTMA
ncbi:hypothetical protein GOODEAATRI_029137 [Goodea atripinnis]|uniref:Uncharacterized protein n=1 Tax=Goodea atripinnis TaxID=208336 RepID=A0ABV0MW45_9TELE